MLSELHNLAVKKTSHKYYGCQMHTSFFQALLSQQPYTFKVSKNLKLFITGSAGVFIKGSFVQY